MGEGFKGRRHFLNNPIYFVYVDCGLLHACHLPQSTYKGQGTAPSTLGILDVELGSADLMARTSTC